VKDPAPLRILHILRTPVGGLFRHVVDLAREQVKRGHEVGIIADSSTGGDAAATTLAELEPDLSLGLSRVPMSRQIGTADRKVVRHVAARAHETKANVLHGHGAKGGAYARLASSPALRVYTPHGGSLHYSATTPNGLAYLAIERWLRRRTDLVLFESEFSRDTFRKKIGEPRFSRVAHNGVRPDELQPVRREEDAADFIFIGELRKLKGVDVLLDALVLLEAEGWNGNAILYGDGPDRKSFEERTSQLGIFHQVRMPGPAPAREAFATGYVLAVPSLAESLPYIVLEAAAASMPMVSTRVGGIPEIYGPDAGALVLPGDAAGLAAALKKMRDEEAPEIVGRLHNRVAAEFTVETMTATVLTAYSEAFRLKRR
jgi:glycosyltransferase involved in cell wall biosynthesis